MKKTLSIITGFLLLLNISVANAKEMHSEKSEDIMKEIYSLEEILGGNNDSCRDKFGKQLDIFWRLGLKDTHFLNASGDAFRNHCLRLDLEKIEENLTRVVNQIPDSQAACSGEYANAIKVNLSKIKGHIECLRKYGDKSKSSATAECLPYAELYSDDTCEDSRWNNAFSQVIDKWDKLQKKISDIRKNTNWTALGDSEFYLGSEADREDIQMKAQKNAEEWVKKNNPLKFKGAFYNFGISWTGKMPDQKKGYFDDTIKHLNDFYDEWQRLTEKDKDKSEVKEKFASKENIENIAEMSYLLDKSITRIKIRSSFDRELIKGFDQTEGFEDKFKCLINSLKYTAYGEKSQVKSCLPGPCLVNGKVVKCDGIKQKTEALKGLLNNHSPGS